jgi:hypothetical protein
MGFDRHLRAALIGVGLAWLGLSTAARGQEKFQARLSVVPVDVTTYAAITGRGSASAVLTGSKLSITGSFEGLRTPAAVARLHRGPVMGVRGPAVGDLTVSKATSGVIAGSLELTAEQLESLRKGRFYVLIHSEKAPDGNLWGWLLR